MYFAKYICIFHSILHKTKHLQMDSIAILQLYKYIDALYSEIYKLKNITEEQSTEIITKIDNIHLSVKTIKDLKEEIKQINILNFDYNILFTNVDNTLLKNVNKNLSTMLKTCL